MTQEELNKTLRLHKLWLEGEANGKRANLSRADLCGANLSWADLRSANLSRADLSWADLRSANLSRADLRWADLSWADLRSANLSRADLRLVDLSWADLRSANLSRANLRWADLSEAILSRANLTNTCLDPYNKPNGLVEGFRFSRRGKSMVVGYRTRDTPIVGQYLDGRVYAADFFSTSDTECHPGLYLWPTLKRAVEFSGKVDIIKVETNPKDVHKAGDKWRCRWFRVLGSVKL